MRPGVVLAACFLAQVALADNRLSLGAKDVLRKAEAGDAVAQFEIGSAYDAGYGAPRDAVQAERWYRAAAGQGHIAAHNSLGRMFQAQKRYSDARGWFEKAADLGHPRAANSLGYLYDMGLGVPRDRRKALEIYMRASSLGSADAMWNIAHMHIAGQLDKPDLATACVWAVRARRFAPRSETKLRGEIEKAMTRLERELPPGGLERCEDEGVNWKPAGLAPVPGASK